MANPTVTIEIKEIGSKHVIGRLAAVRTEASKLTRTKRRLSQQVGRTGESFRKSGKNLKTFTEVMRDLETNAVLALGPLSGVGARIRAIGVLARRGNLFLIGFSVALTAVVAATGLLLIGLFKTRKILEAVESRFIAVTGSILLTRVAMDEALTVSRKFGLSFEAASDGLSRLAAAARDTSLEGEKIRRVFEGISAAVGSMRLGITQAQGIFRAFEQILTKGVVRAEEVNQQLGDVLPGAAKILASAIGVTTSRLQEMLRTGELLAEETLPKVADKMLELFGPQAAAGAESVQGALNSVGTELLVFFDVIETRLPIIAFFVEGLIDMAIALGNLSERFKSPIRETERFFEGLERDRPRFELIGILEADRKKLIGTIREIQAQLLQEIEPIRLEIARLEDVPIQGTFLAPVVTKRLATARAEFNELIGLFDKLNEAVTELKGFTERKLPSIQDIIDAKELERLTRKFDDLRRATGLASDNLNALITGDVGLIRINNAVAKVDKIMSRFTDKTLTSFAKKMKFETVEALREAFIAMELAGNGFVELGKIFESTRTPLEAYNLELARLNALMKEFPGFSDIIKRQIGDIKEKLAESDEIIGVLISSFKDLGSTIVEAISKGEGAFQIFSDFLTNLLEQLLEVIIQLTIINPLLNDLVGGDRKEGLGGFLGTVGALLGGEKATNGEDEAAPLNKLSDAAKAATEAIIGTSNALNKDLTTSVAEAAAGTIAETVVSQTLVGALTELTIAAGAAAIALQSVAASGAASSGADFAASLGAEFASSGAGFSHGGAFTVGGTGGIDDTLVKFRATRGEEIKVTPAGESNERMVVINFNFPPGTNVKEFGEAQDQIGATLAGMLAVASASNN